ncbi:hypothetical protein V8J88_00965 [Massilia sp. W12]|uniref:hypothetical protein n=1 Tax=Massilia sp. W12 TaxID=3126507 RepID=UPI0030D42DE5
MRLVSILLSSSLLFALTSPAQGSTGMPACNAPSQCAAFALTEYAAFAPACAEMKSPHASALQQAWQSWKLNQLPLAELKALQDAGNPQRQQIFAAVNAHLRALTPADAQTECQGRLEIMQAEDLELFSDHYPKAGIWLVQQIKAHQK